MRRLLLVAPGDPLDPADSSASADLVLLETLASRGFRVEVRGLSTTGPGGVDEFIAAFKATGLACGPIPAPAEAPSLPTVRLTRNAVRVHLALRPPGSATPPVPDADADAESAFLRQLDAALAHDRPDLLMARGDDPRAAEILRRGRAAGIATALRVRDCDRFDPTPAPLADTLLATSRFAADYLHELTGRPATVVPDPPNLDRVRATHRQADYLTFLDPTRRGGLLPFARIATELGQRRPDIRILVVASPHEAAALNGCGGDLSTLGTIDVMSPPSDPKVAWARTRLAVLPSLDWAASPDLAVAALLNGVPVVASNRGSLPETLGPAGIVLPLPDRLTPATPTLPNAEEVAPWVEAILRLWDDTEAAESHQSLARDRSQAWTAEACADRLAATFSALGSTLSPPAVPPRRSTAVVLVPNLNGIEPECEDALRQLERQGLRVDRRRGCSQIDVARNEMASDAFQDGASSILFIDADIGFDPADAFRLLARPEPVISGLYAKKKNRALASTFAPDLGPIHLGPNSPGAYPLLYAATGFLRIRAEVLQRMIDELALPHCNLKWGRGVWPFFQPVVVPHPDGHHYLGEDWAFSHRLSQIGVTPLADASFRLWHHGSYGYTWEDAGSAPSRYRDYHFLT